MRIVKKILMGLFVAMFAIACNEGIDPISHVAPGPDLTAPAVTLKFPAEGTQIKVGELVTNLAIDFEVSDDIEVKSIAVSVDGDQVGTLTEFKDYRRVVVEDMMYEGLENGVH